MDHYEIRLSRKTGGPVVYSSTYFSDYAAIRGARFLAQPDDGIEIWKGVSCIYHDTVRDRPGEA
jgi:hypothetical protein